MALYRVFMTALPMYTSQVWSRGPNFDFLILTTLVSGWNQKKIIA